MDEGQLILTEKLEEVMGIIQGLIDVVKHQEKMIQQINRRFFMDKGIDTEFRSIDTEFQDSLEGSEELEELMMEMNVS